MATALVVGLNMAGLRLPSAGLLNTAVSGYLWYGLATTPRIMHPSNPIGSAEDVRFKIAFGLVAAGVLIVGLSVARQFTGRTKSGAS